jgi:hypothetical protein
LPVENDLTLKISILLAIQTKWEIIFSSETLKTPFLIEMNRPRSGMFISEGLCPTSSFASFIQAGYSVKKFTSLGIFFNYGYSLDQRPKIGTQTKCACARSKQPTPISPINQQRPPQRTAFRIGIE